MKMSSSFSRCTSVGQEPSMVKVGVGVGSLSLSRPGRWLDEILTQRDEKKSNITSNI